jgi:hypothetical protein
MTDHPKGPGVPSASAGAPPTHPDDEPEPGYTNDLAVTNPDAPEGGQTSRDFPERPTVPGRPPHRPGHPEPPAPSHPIAHPDEPATPKHRG